MILATASGHFRPNSAANALMAVRACSRSSASRISASILRAVGCTDFGNAARQLYRDLVHPTPLFGRLGPHGAQRRPEPECPVTNCDHRSAHPASFEVCLLYTSDAAD